MKTVAIITTFRQPNWGSVLQAFSLQKVIDKLGYKSVVIDYIYPNKFHYSQGKPKYRHSLWYRSKQLVKKVMVLFHVMKHQTTKMDLLNSFIKDNMNCTVAIKKKTSLKTLLPRFDIYVSGSDQIWNPNTMFGDMSYMFDFVPSGSKKIAYASSFSCDEIPHKYENEYRKYLSSYYAISVREQNGLDLAKKYSGLNNVKLVLDPTLLIEKSAWEKLATKSKKLELPNHYILFYMLAYTYSPNDKMVELLNYMQGKYEYPIVSLSERPLGFEGDFIPIAFKKEVGIYEFLYLFENADMIVTSSFHGTAFSVNLAKPFIALENGKSQSDDRISSLLRRLGMQKQLIFTDSIIDENLSPYYNVVEEQHKLEEMRQDSLSYLESSMRD